MDSPDFDFKDSGSVLRLLKDGAIYSGLLEVDDYWFNGECEVPIFKVDIGGGVKMYLYEFDEWECTCGKPI